MIKKSFHIILNFILIILLFQCSINTKENNIQINKNTLQVHFINVGQGDSILIQVNNKNLLIDSGPNKSEDKLKKYLKKLNISKFDYIIATHPHEDHIGNMSYIINNFDVLNFYAPKVENSTKAFETMVESLIRKDLKIKVLKANIKSIDLGKNIVVDVFSPFSNSYEDLNNYSPIVKISYGNTSFLFTGDAEELSENEVLNAGFDLKCDVLKIGHHGSSSSTSEKFLKASNPSIAVISVGEDNTYGHPTDTVLSRLKETKIYRTDINGNIVITSDGLSLK
ncbi:ComEC/Rec2 family competence protein [Clostridium tertium]|uniref:ComEC/Rec2 family competence protein n=1 Tax=Clostridium TaxID=1485 RepID=UPI001159F808|nr:MULTISPECIES: ComEC/Rec2 family competence protein [Clostridium]MBS5305684.1 MBL fold metallo-hydrolase [Clostridium sp.]MDB1923642.1 ComEC/Rec2 family competence protein [Clostridium tertium]MDB1926044.1 ComEC/Rec2 family competence protein [Clostridium tertium]MDB1929166.1 ComEC/Rec2 family competence protein [Clostridium tertium]MDB1932705.1 ComEC/Rec2 family competence protein [Clostridium tertium]